MAAPTGSEHVLESRATAGVGLGAQNRGRIDALVNARWWVSEERHIGIGDGLLGRGVGHMNVDAEPRFAGPRNAGKEQRPVNIQHSGPDHATETTFGRPRYPFRFVRRFIHWMREQRLTRIWTASPQPLSSLLSGSSTIFRRMGEKVSLPLGGRKPKPLEEVSPIIKSGHSAACASRMRIW